MPRLFNTQVFNDVVVGSTVAALTDPKFDELLASGDAVSVQAIADQITGTTPTLTVSLEHSGDRRNWSAKTTLVSAVSIGPASTNVALGNDPGTSPMLGFARLKITLGGTSPTARVQLFACGRST